MKNRGQAAMEFLMTYGWAIIVVLAAIGALAYFGVLSPSTLLPARTTFAAPIPNVDNAVIGVDGNVTIAFRNNVGSTIAVDDITVADGSCVLSGTGDRHNVNGAGWNATFPATVTNGQAFSLRLNCGALTEGDRFKSDITFLYTNQDSQLQRPHKGSVEGEVVQV